MSNDQEKDVSQLSDEGLLCRDLRHAWKWKSDFNLLKQGPRVVAIEREVECDNCATVRHETISVKTGARIKVKYYYPEGYRIPGTGRIHSTEVRVEWMRRQGIG
jgi:hypothetical protein